MRAPLAASGYSVAVREDNMKENDNKCLYGTNVVLLPYLDKHIPTRHQWLAAGPENRLDRSLNPPSFEEEVQHQKEYTQDQTHCMFLVADAMSLGDPDCTEKDALIGEAHLLIYRDEREHANIEIMLLDRSVRRRTMVCETLLLLLYFGVNQLKLLRFSVLLDHSADAADNRLIFATRGNGELQVRTGEGPKPADLESVTSAPRSSANIPGAASGAPYAVSGGGAVPVVKSSPKAKNRLSRFGGEMRKSLKNLISRKKTDFLGRLTRHLLKEDGGEHWPEELDFELVEDTRIELTMTNQAVVILDSLVSYAKRIKYSSLVSSGSVRSASITRIDGKTLTLVPYAKEHVPMVHQWMQNVEFYTGFGVQPPTLEQELVAQQMMEKDTKNCHAFVVCSKTNIGDDSCPVHPHGRAQIIVTKPGEAQIHIAILNPDLALKAFMLRETLLMLLLYTRMVVSVEDVWMLAATAIRPKEDDKGELWSRRLNFEPTEDGTQLYLKLESNAVKIALRRLCKGMVIREYNRSEIVYEEGSII